jgi:methionyl-tRNA formyltransferase
MAFESIIKFIDSFIVEGSVPKGRVQQEEFSSYFPRLNTMIHGYINWSWDAYQITKFITAFDDPYPGALTRLTNYDEKLHLKSATLLEEYANFHSFQQGIIFRKDENGVYVCAKKGALKINEVINENGENINDRIILGERFFNDYEDLANALSTRIKYDSKGIK